MRVTYAYTLPRSYHKHNNTSISVKPNALDADRSSVRRFSRGQKRYVHIRNGTNASFVLIQLSRALVPTLRRRRIAYNTTLTVVAAATFVETGEVLPKIRREIISIYLPRNVGRRALSVCRRTGPKFLGNFGRRQILHIGNSFVVFHRPYSEWTAHRPFKPVYQIEANV